MRPNWPLVVLSCAALPLNAAEPVVGFSRSSAKTQAEFEQVYLQSPDPQRARKWLAALTEEPHVAGTPQEKKVADYVRERLAGFGLQTEVVRYNVFLTHPREVALELLEPERLPLTLIEPAVEGDKDAGNQDVFPGFHGYSASGRVVGQVVYANYGTRADFERLAKMGVSAEGRIVLARYGAVFRGLKVREAQERGALGVILYSDPADDGYMKGPTYPDGPMRPPFAIQRGSVQFLSLGPGDPSTPGYPSRDDAPRVPREKMNNVPRIPSLPVAYAEAEKILRRLAGPQAPGEWQGGLPFPYRVGPGAAKVAMNVQMDEGLMPIYNVFARIPGREEPDALIIVGNHRDAWTHGAVDPNSGTAVLLETARGLAAALQAGWTPRRTILLASWDAEEYGLVGSTEWGEDRAATLREQAVAYLNVDSAVTGRELRLAGVPSLRDVTLEAAGALRHPGRGDTLAEAWQVARRASWARNAPVDLSAPERPFEPFLPALGSGSDYTVFLDHLGIPSLDLRFTGGYGVYHSVYDNFRWMEKHGDPGFVYHATAARLLGLLTMRLAAADAVPLRFGSYARTLGQQLDALRRDTLRRAREAVPTAAGQAPPIQPDFAPVIQTLKRLDAAGHAADRTVDDLLESGDQQTLRRANQALAQVERGFLSAAGLPGRPWFRHLIVGPGTTTGYAPWPFPGLTQAVHDRDGELFQSEARRVVAALAEAAGRLEAVAALADAGSEP